MLCVFIRIASSKRFKWVHSTYHYFTEDRKEILFLFVSLPGAMINLQDSNYQFLYRTRFQCPKDVPAIRVRLYLQLLTPKKCLDSWILRLKIGVNGRDKLYVLCLCQHYLSHLERIKFPFQPLYVFKSDVCSYRCIRRNKYCSNQIRQ